MQLKHPVHFICPTHAVWPELKNWDGTQLDAQVLSDRSGGILHSWLFRTYYHLRVIGASVTLSNEARPDAINLASVRDFGRKDRRLKSFFVIPQGDAHTSQLANFRILQNGVRPVDGAAAVVWHWPQPGIIPRATNRGDRVDRMCYKGRLLNLDEAFRSDAFLAALKNLNIDYEIDAYSGLRGEHNWNDYLHADVVLAVRNLTRYDAEKKPASKLVNAWFAELPAILGPEPAFRELGRNGEDYIEVKTPQEAIEALQALKANPDLYQRIIQNGKKKRSAYTEEALTKLWLETLNGPIAETYERWQKTSALSKILYSVRGLLREPRARKEDHKAISTGLRILDS